MISNQHFLHERFKGKTALYLQQLPTFEGAVANPGMVHMLNADLYGTPQACKVYITGAYEHLRKHGYEQCKSDNNVFRRVTRRGTVDMALTIDDFLVAASSLEVHKELVDTLELKYKVSDLDKATRILNWTLTRPQPGNYCYHLSQPHMIRTSWISWGWPAVILSSRHKPQVTRSQPDVLKKTRFHRSIPTPQHWASSVTSLTVCTRPDVAFITGSLADHTKDPALRHWQAMQYVARYLNATKTEGLYYAGTKQGLEVFADADFADCRVTRQSTHGNLYYYAGTPISWSSRWIKTVVISSCAAEYISNSKAGEHLTWLRSLIGETTDTLNASTPLHNDDAAAEDICQCQRTDKKIQVY